MSDRGDLLVLIERLGIEARDLTDVGDLAHLLLVVRRGMKALGRLEDDIEDALYLAIPGKSTEVEGVGLVEKKRGGYRKTWDHDALLRLVTARARDERRFDEATGEYEAEAEAVSRVLSACAGIGYWRVGALTERGIDADEYCERVEGRPSILFSVADPAVVPEEAA